MEGNPSSVSNKRSADRRIPSFLLKKEVNSMFPPLLPIRNNLNPVHNKQPCSFKVHIHLSPTYGKVFQEFVPFRILKCLPLVAYPIAYTVFLSINRETKAMTFREKNNLKIKKHM
jgi:hypothetical protein